MHNYRDDTRRFYFASRRAQLSGLDALMTNCRVVTAVKSMIHQLQRERGMSNVFLGSQGLHFKKEREQQVGQTEEAERVLRSMLKSQCFQHDANGITMRLLTSITIALQGLDHLPLLREKVANHDCSPLSSTQAYSRLITALLSVVFDAADVANEPKITRVLVSLFNFMQGKEYSGQERAWGAIGFSASHFDHSLCEKLEHLQLAQQESFDIFYEFANQHEQQLWDSLTASAVQQQLIKMRLMIAQLVDGNPIASEISEVWYSLATQRIDAMQSIEDALTENLLEAAKTLISEAQRATQEQRDILHQPLLDSSEVPGELTILFDHAQPGLHGADTKEADIGAAARVNGHQSFYALLQSQAAQIRQVTEELEMARVTIVEQKNIDRAKLFIMQQWRLSEPQAYRRLQQKAMEANMRIAELAAQIIKQIDNSNSHNHSRTNKTML